MCLISLWMSNHAPIYAVGDTAWTRHRLFYHYSRIYKSLFFLQLFIDLNQNTMLNTVNMCFILLRDGNNTPVLAMGDTAWTRGQIFT